MTFTIDKIINNIINFKKIFARLHEFGQKKCFREKKKNYYLCEVYDISMTKKICLILPCALLLAGAATGSVSELPPPAVPDSLQTQSERAAYTMLHFWDAMDWNDPELAADINFLEKNCMKFYSLFGFTDSIAASKAVEAMLAGASANISVYTRIADIAGRCLNRPDSPMIDDESYAVVVDRLLADRKIGDANLLRLEDTHRILMQNRKGSKAADFEIITREGRKIKLSDAVAGQPLSALMFYDPDCTDCAELERHLEQNCPGTAGIILVCPFETDDDLWETHAASMPESWTVAHTADPEFEDKELYFLPTAPTVYLLGSDMTVLAKNLTIGTIDDALKNALN